MRWLLLKDLQILRRSPLLTALLVIYPIVLAVLIGFAVSRDPDKPRVAFFNEIERRGGPRARRGRLQPGARPSTELCERVDCVDVDSREEAIDKVRDGEVLAALILPEDFLDKLQAQLAGAGLEPAEVEVYVNEDDPVKARLVDDRISSLITEANLILSDEISEQLLGYLDVLVEGGEFEVPFLGQTLDVLGLEKTEAILKAVRADLSGAAAPGRRPGDPVRRAGPREPRLRRRAARLGRRADRGREGGRQRRRAAARHLRDLGRDRDHADVRDGAAGRRLAGARARGEHLRPPHPGPRRPLGAAGREDRPRDDLLDRGRGRAARGAGAVRQPASGSGRP